MKKLLALLLALAMCLSMFACGDSEDKKSNDKDDDEDVVDIDELDADELEEYIEELTDELADLKDELEEAEEDEDEEAIEELEDKIKDLEKQLKKANKALAALDEDEDDNDDDVIVTFDDDEEATVKPMPVNPPSTKPAATTEADDWWDVPATTTEADDWWDTPATTVWEDEPEPDVIRIIEPAVEYGTVGYYHWEAFLGYASAYSRDAEELASLVLTCEVGGEPLNLFMGGTMPIEVGSEYFPGFDNYVIRGYEEAAAFMPMMGSIAYVGYVFDLKDGVDAEDFIEDLVDNANPRWQICVTADQTVVGAVGDLVLFLMCPSTYEMPDEAFGDDYYDDDDWYGDGRPDDYDDDWYWDDDDDYYGDGIPDDYDDDWYWDDDDDYGYDDSGVIDSDDYYGDDYYGDDYYGDADAVGYSTPEEAMEELTLILSAMASGSVETFAAITGGDLYDLDEAERVMVECMLRNFDYKIGTLVYNGDVASVAIEITSIDTMALATIVEEAAAPYSDYDSQLAAIKTVLNGDVPTFTTSYEINFEKTNGMWNITMESALAIMMLIAGLSGN